MITNDDIYQLLYKSDDFMKSHSVMSQQSEKLAAIVDGWLKH